jgi:hypothetical protein
VDKQEGMISRLENEADLCRNDGAGDIAALLDEAALCVGDLQDMVRWAYSKLHRVGYSKPEDALMLDRMKLLLEHGVGV